MSKLIKEIEKFKTELQINVPEHILEVSLAETKVLEEKKISHLALQVGDIAKDFRLANSIGEKISLYESFEENDFVVINFYRGIWCPVCNLEIQSLQDFKNDFDKLNTKIIAVSPQNKNYGAEIKDKHNLEFEVLSDEDYRVEEEYGLVYSLSEKLIPIYTSWGFSVKKINEKYSHDIPIPATYVVNKNKEIIFAFIEEDYTKRCAPEDILTSIKNNIENN